MIPEKGLAGEVIRRTVAMKLTNCTKMTLWGDKLIAP
jgi:hypothetical protein